MGGACACVTVCDTVQRFSLQGYMAGLLGNTLMCTHFAGRGESSAVKVQVIGIANNMLVLLQVGALL